MKNLKSFFQPWPILNVLPVGTEAHETNRVYCTVLYYIYTSSQSIPLAVIAVSVFWRSDGRYVHRLFNRMSWARVGLLSTVRTNTETNVPWLCTSTRHAHVTYRVRQKNRTNWNVCNSHVRWHRETFRIRFSSPPGERLVFQPHYV